MSLKGNSAGFEGTDSLESHSHSVMIEHTIDPCVQGTLLERMDGQRSMIIDDCFPIISAYT
jgi:hypothetical protein